MINQGIEVIIKDEDMPAAITLLKETNLRPCSDLETCVVPTEDNPSSPTDFHMHVCGDSNVDVSLRKHSNTLWFMPPPALLPSATKSTSLDANDHPKARDFYTLASDSHILPEPRPGRGHGAFSPDGPAVVVPLPHKTLEAYIRLASRHRETYGSFFLSMLTHIEEFFEAAGQLDDKYLSEPCQRFWRALKPGKIRLQKLMNVLHHDLMDQDGTDVLSDGD